MRRILASLSVAGLALFAPAASGEVHSADDRGFEVGANALIAAPPGAVWQALTMPAQWWDSAHTWSGKAANLSLAAVAGGCFCERMPHGGGVEHMRVVRSEPGRTLVMTGALGPLQAEPVQGVLTISIAARDGGSTLTWSYAVSGLRSTKGAALAGPVDQVLTEQFARLARYAAARNDGARPPR
ncbi:MAG: SRPBCC domain-containing protein [Proteobacteria bacterium]|nr:SRPBCC domain-containing protein [Pseudomonadota bacterium]